MYSFHTIIYCPPWIEKYLSPHLSFKPGTEQYISVMTEKIKPSRGFIPCQMKNKYSEVQLKHECIFLEILQLQSCSLM